MINVNDFKRMSDNDTIEAAMAALGSDRTLVIPPRESDIEPERDYWLLDRAILIPENTTVVLRNCKIKLSDRCRDNFFRTSNSGMGISYPEKIKNVHLRGEGSCVLEGADHPRAAGDGTKVLANPCPYNDEDLIKYAYWVPEERKQSGKLDFWDKHAYSYGTDAGKEGESQYGDWRGIGVLFVHVENFSIENIKIVDSHGWGISLEACSYGRVEKIEFDMLMSKVIDGMRMNMENQDGVDIRNGCHHITVSDITGRTGDDIVALTAIRKTVPFLGGEVKSTHAMHHDWSIREADIHHIVVRNVVGYSNLCYIVRLLACDTHIYDVIIDGVIDCMPDDMNMDHFGTILLGERDLAYGKNLTDGITRVTVSNVICRGRTAIKVGGYLSNSVISNVINENPNCPVVTVERDNGLVNVATSNLISYGDKIIGK